MSTEVMHGPALEGLRIDALSAAFLRAAFRVFLVGKEVIVRLGIALFRVFAHGSPLLDSFERNPVCGGARGVGLRIAQSWVNSTVSRRHAPSGNRGARTLE
jgi:hypothetical protein